jgi:hypothetical protein
MLEVLEGIICDGITQRVFREHNPGLTTALGFGLMQTIANPELAKELGADYPSLFAGTIEFFLHGVLAGDASV